MSSLIALIDYDSLIYKSCYKVVTIQDIKQKISQGKTRAEMEQWILDESINRLCNMGDGLMTEIESQDFIIENGLNIAFCEYFITPRKSIRKEIFSDYKANRDKRKNPMTKWVNMVRNYLLKSDFAITKNGFEADDLIADRAKELGQNQCIIVSLDKDLKQIPGIHFNFYRKPSKEVDQFGNRVKNQCTGLSIVSDLQSEYNFWYQMLVGDSGDNVKGLKGIGPKKAEKYLNDVTDFESVVKDLYRDHYGNEWVKEYEKCHMFLWLGCHRNYETINMAKSSHTAGI